MTQMERVKPCVIVTQKESGRIAVEGSLRGNGDSFTQRKMVKFHLERKSKLVTV